MAFDSEYYLPVKDAIFDAYSVNTACRNLIVLFFAQFEAVPVLSGKSSFVIDPRVLSLSSEKIVLAVIRHPVEIQYGDMRKLHAVGLANGIGPGHIFGIVQRFLPCSVQGYEPVAVYVPFHFGIRPVKQGLSEVGVFEEIVLCI